MKQVIIDRQKCTGCGVCAAICPYRVIAMNGRRGRAQRADLFSLRPLPGSLSGRGDHHAWLHSPTAGPGHHREECRWLQRRTKADGAGAGRPHAFPTFLPQVPEEDRCRSPSLVDLVKIGTTAPSGTNSQGWNFVILPTREDVLVLGGLVADYYRRLNRLAANPLLRGLVKISGRRQSRSLLPQLFFIGRRGPAAMG